MSFQSLKGGERGCESPVLLISRSSQPHRRVQLFGSPSRIRMRWRAHPNRQLSRPVPTPPPLAFLFPLCVSHPVLGLLEDPPQDIKQTRQTRRSQRAAVRLVPEQIPAGPPLDPGPQQFPQDRTRPPRPAPDRGGPAPPTALSHPGGPRSSFVSFSKAPVQLLRVHSIVNIKLFVASSALAGELLRTTTPLPRARNRWAHALTSLLPHATYTYTAS